MRRRFLLWTALFALAAMSGCALHKTARQASSLPQWHPCDLEFTSPAPYANPFLEVTLSGEFHGPGGERLKLEGFYDGDRTWKIRFAPTRPGRWRYVTRSNDARLNGQKGQIDCQPNTHPQIHGKLLVDARHPHHFRWEDGAPYLLFGFEADWLGLIDFDNDRAARATQIIELYAAHGFNHALLNLYAYDTKWRPGRSEPLDFGPPAMHPWPGPHQAHDFARLNPDFFRHFDRVMTAMMVRGVVAHLFFKVYNKEVNWPTPASREDDLFFRYVTARYAAFPNVVWDFAKESGREKDTDYIRGRLTLIRAHDPYGRLLTTHTDGRFYSRPENQALIDFPTHQTHKDLYGAALRQRAGRAWPIVNSEYGYEYGPKGPKDKTYGAVNAPEELLRRTCEVLMAGAYPCYYYTHHAWDVVRPEAPAGLRYYKRLADFWRRGEWWNLAPADGLLGGAAGTHCLAEPGRQYLVYLDQVAQAGLDLSGVEGPLSGVWLNALSGAERPSGPLGPGRVTLQNPWPGAPALLRLAK